jgi:hypothetical protein
MQIGNFGEGAARTHATPEVVPLGKGIAACIARINSLGGIRQRQLVFGQVSARDDPALFIDRFRLANEQGATAILCPCGGANVKRLLDEHVLDTLGPAVVGGHSGVGVLRHPGHPKLLHVRAGDGRQIEHVLKHAKLPGIRRVAALAWALRTAHEIDIGGYPVDFSNGNGGSRCVDIAMMGPGGRLRYRQGRWSRGSEC